MRNQRGEVLRLLDGGRQWPTEINSMADHHRIRYEFAAFMAKGRTLDAACGVGYGSYLISQSAPQVVGVDLSHDAINWAKRYFPGPSYICGDITKEPWEGEFETVVSIETIEHLQDPSPALKAFRRACLGTLIASVPNEERYPFKAENFASDEFPHYRHYTPKEFDQLLEDHGFKVIERNTQDSKTQPWMKSGTDGIFLVYVCT